MVTLVLIDPQNANTDLMLLDTHLGLNELRPLCHAVGLLWIDIFYIKLVLRQHRSLEETETPGKGRCPFAACRELELVYDLPAVGSNYAAGHCPNG